MSDLLKGFSSLFGEQNLRKYHDESTKVSSVSVSLVHFFPLIIIFFQSSFLSSGLPFDLRLIFSGSLTGNSSSGITTILFFSSYAIGIGHPQYLWREIPQSFNLKLVFFFLFFFSLTLQLFYELTHLELLIHLEIPNL